MTRVDDIVLEDASDDELRDRYGPVAGDAIIAFRRFLKLPQDPPDEEDVVVWRCPQHWYDYAVGKIDSTEVLRIDDEQRHASVTDLPANHPPPAGGTNDEGGPSDRTGSSGD